MNCLKARRKYDAEQEELAWQKRQEEEQAMIDAMTEEEREEYFKKKEEEKKRIHELLSIPFGMANGPYSYLK